MDCIVIEIIEGLLIYVREVLISVQTIEWIQLGATIGTAVAAIFAYKSAKETQKSNQAQIVVTITGQYSAQQMKDAIEHLCSWKRQNEKDFALQYQLGLNAPTPGKEALQLDDERRLYAHHFNQIRVLV